MSRDSRDLDEDQKTLHNTGIMNINTTGFQEAVDRLGGVNAFTRTINAKMEARGLTHRGKEISRHQVSRWAKGKCRFPAELAGIVEEVSGVRRKRLRPDVF